jgi:hypothetical protein
VAFSAPVRGLVRARPWPVLPRFVDRSAPRSPGPTADGYLFQGRKHKLVIRRTYQEDFGRSAAKAGLPSEFIPHALRHQRAPVLHRCPSHISNDTFPPPSRPMRRELLRRARLA